MTLNYDRSFLFSRESGGSAKYLENRTLACSASRKIVPLEIRSFSNTFIKSTSRTVWIQGKENVLAILNSHGQIVAYNTLAQSNVLIISQETESCFKCFFARDFLFMAVKDQSQETCSFFLVPLRTLQNGAVERVPVLLDLKIKRNNVIEIDNIHLRIVIETENFIEIWSILEGKSIAKYPRNPSIKYQVSEDYFIFWEKCGNQSKFGVLKFGQNFFRNFNILSGEDVYLCKVVNDELILGFPKCNIQIISLFTMESRVLYKGIPGKIFELEKTGKILSIFSDFSCVVNGQDSGAVQLFPSHEFFVSELENALVVCSGNGQVGLVRDSVEVINTQISGIQQIGTNLDTNQIYIATKGKIFIIE